MPLVEDAAQAHGTSLSGRYVGTHGMIGTFSTHARKLICTGEGGFCLTNDLVLADRLRQLRNLGRPPSGGEFGVGFGLNYKLPALAAALGRVQLSRLASRIAHRSRATGIESDVLRYNYRPPYRTPVLACYTPTRPCRNAEHLVTTLLTVPCHERVATDELARIGAAWRG